MEIWRDIEQYEGLYQISNKGNVRRLNAIIIQQKNGTYFQRLTKGRVLKFNDDKQGYKLVHLCKDGKRRVKKVHRLVAETFIENKENKPYVNHKDGMKWNNNIENLEWVTPSENNIHAYKLGLTDPLKNLK